MTDTIDKDDPMWALKLCHVEEAWNKKPDIGKKKGEGIIILHPDTGYTKHPELVDGSPVFMEHDDTQKYSRNFLEGSEDNSMNGRDLMDGLSKTHGTKTASLMIASENDQNIDPKYKNITGIAPSAKLIPCRVTNFVVMYPKNVESVVSEDSWSTLACLTMPYVAISYNLIKLGFKKISSSEDNLIKSIYYAIDLNKKDEKNGITGGRIGVISISLAILDKIGFRIGAKLDEALVAAKENGIIICAAAGQFPEEIGDAGVLLAELISLSGHIAYPANSPNSIATAACDFEYKKLDKGFYGESVDITAPGVGIWVAKTEKDEKDEYIYTSYVSEGTSYSTAITAGACALWQAFHGRDVLINIYDKKNLLPLFKWCLNKSCKQDVENWNNKTQGKGVLNVEALLDMNILPGKKELQTEIASGNI